MVVPHGIFAAAGRGDNQAVLAWLDAGPRDINELHESGYALLHVVGLNVGRHQAGNNHIELARELLRRGADVNVRSGSRQDGKRETPFMMALSWLYKLDDGVGLRRDFLMMLLDAGSDPNASVTSNIGDNGTRCSLNCLALTLLYAGPSGPDRDVFAGLIRAGASLDRASAVDGIDESIDATMARCETRPESPDFVRSEHWAACKALVADVRAAGGTWAAYARRPRKAFMRLRSLVLRGRALPKLSCDAAVVLTCRRLPNDLAWHVLKFWRVTGEATGDII